MGFGAAVKESTGPLRVSCASEERALHSSRSGVHRAKWIQKGILSASAAALLLSACGKATLELGNFAPYVQKFEDESRRFGPQVRVVDLSIRFGELDPGFTGLCRRRFAETPTIIVEPKAWEKASEWTRESLMFHELGHCILNENHREAMMPAREAQGVMPVSLMNPIVVAGAVYRKNRDYYLDELFTHGS